MAKELPYFKFEPNQWENGNIQILSREDKGLFIDLCSMYWSRLGDLPFKLAVQKLCGGNASAFDSLCKEFIFEVIDGNVYIKFLSEQLLEFENISKKNSNNAKERWEKHRKQKDSLGINAVAYNSHYENNAIREDKIIEDKSKQDILLKKESKRFLTPSIDEIKDYCLERKNNIDAEAFFNFYESKGWMIGKSKMKSWKAAIRTWEKNTLNQKNNNNGKATTEHFEKRQANFDPVRAMQTYIADKERRASEMAERISKLQSDSF